MKKVVLKTPENFIYKESIIPEPKDNEVIIKVKKVGICGSDIHTYYGKHPFISLPIVLGHEFAGIIHSKGNKVLGFEENDRVVICPILTCGKCENCINGKENICQHLGLIGCQRTGGFSEYVCVPEHNLLKIPDSLSFEEAVLTEPFAVGVHAINKTKVSKNDKIAIIGAGTIGLMTAFAARGEGVSDITLFDVSEMKCKLAMDLGFKAVNNNGLNPKNAFSEIYGLNGPDAVFECVGKESSINFCVKGSSKGTKIVVCGVFEEDINFPISLVQDRELEILGSLTYTFNEFKKALELISEGTIAHKKLITNTFEFNEIPKAFEFIEKNKNNIGKILINSI